MSGLCDTCQRLKRMGCGLVRDGVKSCDWYERESMYDRLFGTPERAARTLMEFAPLSCFRCALYDYDVCGDVLGENCLLGDYDKLLKWLRDEDGVVGEPDTIRNELMDCGLPRGDEE